ncbi:MAG: low molecular weight phosphotyrosine protein phosphatase [Malacoplasma sp.]|nr:low molecular weight phosphotyrosine protein phosphatase [Malacoplasma sp.]
MRKVITFVCLGNICRSPIAELVFRNMVKQTKTVNQYVIQSAGTSGWNDGQKIHEGSKRILAVHNIDSSKFVSKKITQQMFDESDLVLVMDDKNLQDVRRMFGSNAKIQKLTKYCILQKYDIVPDPWYTNNFELTYDIINDALINLFNLLEKDAI